jgi:hypothetical protein
VQLDAKPLTSMIVRMVCMKTQGIRKAGSPWHKNEISSSAKLRHLPLAAFGTWADCG